MLVSVLTVSILFPVLVVLAPIVSAQPHGSAVQHGAGKPAFYTASDGSPLTVKLDSDGHIVSAEGQHGGLRRTLTLPRWPQNNSMTFSETGKL